MNSRQVNYAWMERLIELMQDKPLGRRYLIRGQGRYLQQYLRTVRISTIGLPDFRWARFGDGDYVVWREHPDEQRRMRLYGPHKPVHTIRIAKALDI